jgi:hypothetical protein
MTVQYKMSKVMQLSSLWGENREKRNMKKSIDNNQKSITPLPFYLVGWPVAFSQYRHPNNQRDSRLHSSFCFTLSWHVRTPITSHIQTHNNRHIILRFFVQVSKIVPWRKTEFQFKVVRSFSGGWPESSQKFWETNFCCSSAPHLYRRTPLWKTIIKTCQLVLH